MGSENVRVHAVVHGRVQMVGFRGFVIRHAGDAGLSGTVRNLEDGTVEVILEGPEGAVREMVDRLHAGPSHAHVERVDAEYGAATGALPGMMVTR